MKFSYIVLTFSALILLGAGCSSATIKKDIGSYSYNEGAKGAVDGAEEGMFSSDLAQYNGDGRIVNVGVSKELSLGGAKQFVGNMLKTGDGASIKTFSVGNGTIYYVSTQEDQGPTCYMVWYSTQFMIRITGIPSCTPNNDIVQKYVKKYPPMSI